MSPRGWDWLLGASLWREKNEPMLRVPAGREAVGGHHWRENVWEGERCGGYRERGNGGGYQEKATEEPRDGSREDVSRFPILKSTVRT